MLVKTSDVGDGALLSAPIQLILGGLGPRRLDAASAGAGSVRLQGHFAVVQQASQIRENVCASVDLIDVGAVGESSVAGVAGVALHRMNLLDSQDASPLTSRNASNYRLIYMHINAN